MANRYAIVDIETTGGLAKRDKITEIAIVVSDGKKVIAKYESLVNPGISIPYNITRITGIDNDMVRDAPKFYEIAKKIVEYTEGCVFVAHNVQFDYSFIQKAFSDLGYTFSKRRLCTVRMSRKTFPGFKSYSLGNLIKEFRIEVKDRHRAMEDALATTIIFHKILEKKPEHLNERKLISEAVDFIKYPEGITKEFVLSLPKECGVYYMLDKENEIVYIGKSINIQKRIKQHFSKVDSKTSSMLQKVRSIKYELTGSELAALMKEGEEIKSLKPEINKALRRSDFPFCVYLDINENGYQVIKYDRVSDELEKKYEIVNTFGSSNAAKAAIKSYTNQLELCKRINNIEKGTDGPCFDFQIQKCYGACLGLEDTNSYNERVEQLRMPNDDELDENYVIMEQGRDKDENAIFLVEGGNYLGFGYLNRDDQSYNIEEIKEAIAYTKPDKQLNRIIKNYLISNPSLKILKY